MPAGDAVGDQEFRDYFVVHTPAMFERYQAFVEPAIPLADAAAAERIGEHWQLEVTGAPAYGGRR